MTNYSSNWHHLKSILVANTVRNQRPEHYTYEDHIHAKALAIFLANANLSAPKLDRETIGKLIDQFYSEQQHPDGTPKERINRTLAQLEQDGFLTFYANWCTVHCQTIRSQEDIDPSLIELVQVMQYLKTICYSDHEKSRPKYTGSTEKITSLLALHWPNSPVDKLLPELILIDNNFVLTPGNRNFCPLASTYLWLTLRDSFEPKQAFQQWMLALRVNCEWAMPVLFEYFEFDEKTKFFDELLAYLVQDTALELPLETMWKQYMNDALFAHIVTPVKTSVELTFDEEGNSSSKYQDIIDADKPTMATLSSKYSLQNTDFQSDLHNVQVWQKFRNFHKSDPFYTSLLVSSIEDSIRIDEQFLTASNFIEKIFEIAESRPILKHILLNLVPEHSGAIGYKIYLLSRPNNCDVAIFYLSSPTFFNLRSDNQSATKNIAYAYQQFVCHEYLRTVEREPEMGLRLFKIVEHLGDKYNLYTGDFSKKIEYQFLICFLESLNDLHIAQLGTTFTQHLVGPEDKIILQSQKHFYYFLGFWLIERLEITGIDIKGNLGELLKSAFMHFYKKEFDESIAGRRHDLQPNAFFSALPWHKLVESDGARTLLELSNKNSDWREKISFANKDPYSAVAAIRHYLLVLMSVGRPKRLPHEWNRIAKRVEEIIRTVGFGNSAEAAFVINGDFFQDQFDLWTPFCSYSNVFEDSLFEDFFERCLELIPLDKLLVLLERCTVNARIEMLQDAIACRQSPQDEDLALSSLSRAFVSACNMGRTVLGAKLISAAKELLSHQRFSNKENPYVASIHREWAGYEYNLQLISAFETLKEPNEFSQFVNQIPLPLSQNGKPNSNDDRNLQQECTRFRRYIIAAANYETNPEKCATILEALYNESKNSDHSFLLFKSRLALLKINNDTETRRQALSLFLESLNGKEPDQMPTAWVAAILDTYRYFHHNRDVDVFWWKLTIDQQDRIEILLPYCKVLIARGEPLIAQHIVNRYMQLNQKKYEGVELTELIDQLCKAIPSEHSMSQLIQSLNEGSQRDVVQLRKHYTQIASKDFDEYVAIVDQNKSPQEFLKNVILGIAQELLLRKKNLQLLSGKNSDQIEKTYDLAKEDLINDWFVSLFDMRMTEARIGMRDQKRGGESESGKSPGEIDGFITDAKNRRIAIFEAFRLDHLDKAVIAKHLNKISGYNQESLSPVFIIGYCSAANFYQLTKSYSKYISELEYKGFTSLLNNSGVTSTIEVANLWLGMERRYRNSQEVVFYHFLLDMGSAQD